MSLEFVTSAARWQQIYDQLPDFAGKIYYSHAYCSTLEANGDGRAAALFYTGNQVGNNAENTDAALSTAGADTPQKPRNLIFYPVLLRPVPAKIGGDGCFDLETPYGYGGPQTFCCDQVTIDGFGCEFTEWARRQNIVAEFVRFNPLSANQSVFSDQYRTDRNRITVSIPLQHGFSEILAGCSAARQRNYRRAQREGLVFRRLDNLSDFCRLYQQTMKRLNADSYYFFSQSCFDALAAVPDADRWFVGVFTPDGRLAAAGIFLIDAISAHYHLGASEPEFKDLQANAFMMLEVAREASKAGKQLLHLGGGLSLAEDDQLYRFKAGFSTGRHDFYIGRRIHQQDAYQAFSQRWQQLTGAAPQILLHYHYGVKHENF